MTTREGINFALKTVGLVGLSGIAVAAPNAVQGLSILLHKSPAKNSDSKRILKELRRQGLVHISPCPEGFTYTLTPAGAYRLQQVIIDELEIPPQKKWDKKWRAVSFDIPVKLSTPRAYFVKKLSDLGFVMIQKSLWVHPYPGFEQVEQLAGHYNVRRYCTLFEISKLDELTARKLTRHFFSG